MASYKEYFAGKRITVMGLGLLGRGIGDVRFLAECGAELIVTDLKSEQELASSLALLKELSITYHLGGHHLEDFNDRDLILKAAGVPLDSPYIAEAKKNNIPVRMSADLFAELSGAAIVGVTGTRGKSTVAHLLAHMLRKAGKPVLLGGNIRDVSTLALLPKVTADTIAVLELDSWQLQGFGEAKLSPHVAVLTAFMPDHMNYYLDDMKAYFADKANIFLNQNADDFFILGEQASPYIKEYGYQNNIRAHTAVAGANDLPKGWMLNLLGEHNRYNAGIAVVAARTLGLGEEEIRNGVESFEGVEGRLQYLGSIRTVRVYNDNNATTPDATIAAIQALAKERPLSLIVGGADKGLPLDALAETINMTVAKVFLLDGENTTGSSRLEPLLKVDYKKVTTVREALRFSTQEDTMSAVVFSPAFASFGMFKNEYDRNDQFVAAVKELQQ